MPSNEYLKKLAVFFCVSVDDLLSEQKENPVDNGEALDAIDLELIRIIRGLELKNKQSILVLAREFDLQQKEV